MSRTLTTAVQDALEAASVALAVFVELDFGSGFVRVTNAPHDLQWNGYTWTGLGKLGGIEPVEEGASLEARGVALRLSGVPVTGSGASENIAIALGEHYQGRDARIWVAPLKGNSEQTDYLEFNFLKGQTLSPVNGDATITFTRSGATATRVNSSGLIETVAANVPRFDYDPVTLACKGLLIEEARTNLCLQSNAFTTTWANGGADPVQNTVGPDGASSAWTLTDNSAVAFENIGQGFVVADDALTHTFSIYVKKTSGATNSFGVNTSLSGGTPTSDTTRLNTNTGKISGGTFAEDAGDYWRFQVSLANNGTGNTALQVAIYPATGTNSGDNPGGDDAAAQGSAVIYGAQLEKTSFASSYIPTTTASVTRNADVAPVSSIGGFFNASEGTIVIEAETDNVSVVDHKTHASFNDGLGNDSIKTEFLVTTGRIFGEVFDGAVQQAAPNMAAYTLGTAARAAFAFKANDFAGSGNGGAVVTDSSGSMPTVDRLHLGCDLGTTRFLNGHLRRFKCIPQRLRNEDLVALSGDFDANVNLVRNPYAVLADPKLLFLGRMDNMDIVVGPTATITLKAESRLADLERPRVLRFNDATQQALFPGDRGLEFVEAMIEKAIKWGRA